MTHEKAAQFLKEQDPNLHTASHVEGIAKVALITARVAGDNRNTELQKPTARITEWLQNIDGRHSLVRDIPTADAGEAATLRNRQARHIERFAVDSGVATREHLQTEARIALAQGHGHIAVTPELLASPEAIEKGQQLRGEQIAGLTEWVEYLNGPDTSYETWFKYYAINGVTKLGKWDKEKKKFGRRNEATIAPFPQLSRGALSRLHSWLHDVRLNGDEIPDEFSDSDKPERQVQLKSALKGGNFGQLYALALDAVNEGGISEAQKDIVSGKWKTYEQHSDPRELFDDLQGFGLDWCTATGYSTTADHINGGDFKVFYSEDEDGAARIPRAAIRMQDGEVAEVRGILPGQELEPEMADAVIGEVKALPGGEVYLKKAEDMKRLTAIGEQLGVRYDKAGTPTFRSPDAKLSADEVRFLYELDSSIDNFGYRVDPRIAEFRKARGERDHAELAQLLPEVLMAQARVAYDTYRDMALALTKRRGLFRRNTPEIMTEAAFAGLLDRKEAEWRESGVMDYLVRQLVEKGSRPNLVATPNVLADWEQVKQLADQFGEGQPYETYTNDTFLKQYSPEELSGALVGEPVRLSIIPSAFNMRSATVDEQKEQLAAMRAAQPGLNFRVPSMLEAIAYWQTLRARGAGVNSFDATYIRHFDQPVRRGGDWLFVPGSCVRGAGSAHLAGSLADDRRGGRVSVG